MAIKNENEIKQLVNTGENGFHEAIGENIRTFSRFIQTSSDRNAAEHNPKSYSSPGGHYLAEMDNLRSSAVGIRKIHLRRLAVFCVRLAAAPYEGKEISFEVHRFSPDNPIDRQCIQDLKKREDWKNAPEQILQMKIGGLVCGSFIPEWKCFLPAAGFQDTFPCGQSPKEYLQSNPHVRSRCRALVETMLANGAYPDVFRELLDDMGGPLSPDEMAVYRAEMKTALPADVTDYIRKTSGCDPEAACGCMGTNTYSRLLDSIALIRIGTDSCSAATTKKVSDGLAAVAPVKNTAKISKASFRYSDTCCTGSDGIPEWIEFTAELDNVLYHKIFSLKNGLYRICSPQNYVDLCSGVPDGILRKYNYLIQDSGIAARSNAESGCHWEEFPKDSQASRSILKTRQSADTWTILQRSSRITRIELYDADGSILGSIFPEQASPFKRIDHTVYVSLDPAGARSVRLMSEAGSGKSTAVEFTGLIRPMTPMSRRELERASELYISSGECHKKYFDSLLQLFDYEQAGPCSQMMVASRIYQPDQLMLFEALKNSPGTMTEAMTNIGVCSNPKEILTRSDLNTAERADSMNALKMYIGTMLLESIMALSRQGRSPQAGNLEFLVSYPENGSGEGITKLMKEAVSGALEAANEYLTAQNQLAVGKNVTLISESEATAKWHKNNPPTTTFIGDTVAAGTPDYGYSTLDFSLRINGRLYVFSVPYGGKNITNVTLAEVYAAGRDPERLKCLAKCFSDGSQELIAKAMEAILAAAETADGKLYDQLAFILPLNQLFNTCTFCVTGANADTYMRQVQQLVEAKLNVALPAYADSIVRAIQAGDLDTDSEILLAPVGKGSLSLNNTGADFENRFTDRLKNLIGKKLGANYTGTILLLPNNDTDKVSVAQGLIDLRESDFDRTDTDLVLTDDPIVHYLDLVYGPADSPARTEFMDELNAADTAATKAEYIAKRRALYNNAFENLMDNYTYTDFEGDFNLWGYTGTGDGSFDDSVRSMAKDSFDNLIAELKDSKKSLIMSCPGVEKEMICGAMIDLIIERMSAR